MTCKKRNLLLLRSRVLQWLTLSQFRPAMLPSFFIWHEIGSVRIIVPLTIIDLLI
jgi:hypothetical protein